jgi:gas vesicle protein
MSAKGSFFLGFLVGGVAGAVVVLLKTPQSGERTRMQIQQKSIELKSQAGDLAREVQERGKEVATSVATQAGDTARQVQERGKELAHEKLPLGGEPASEEPVIQPEDTTRMFPEEEEAIPGPEDTEQQLPAETD